MSKSNNDSSGIDIRIDSGDNLDRSPASASPFARPNETGQIRGREYDASTVDGRDLSTKDSTKRGSASGRKMGSQISKSDCDTERWERLRKRDEGILTFDADRYDSEGESYLELHRGAGVETDGKDRVRSFTLMSVVSNIGNELNADNATENEARITVASLSNTETNGRKFEATAAAALVVARDQYVANRIRRIDAESDELQAIQNALRRAQSPHKRFRVLNNVPNVIDNKTVVRLCKRRLDASNVEEKYGFDVENTIKNVGWSK